MLSVEGLRSRYGRIEVLHGVDLDVKAGDKVIFGQYSGNTVKVDGEELLIMSEAEILAVIEG